MNYEVAKTVAWTVLAGTLLTGAGCGTAPSTVMINLEPPDQWAHQLSMFRESRDDAFVEAVDSPLLPEDVKSFEGLDYWEPDPAFYFVGPVHTYDRPEQLTVFTTTGRPRPGEKYGWIDFAVNGTPQRLQVYRMLDQPDNGPSGYLVAFTDGTSGEETYPAGRYVNLIGSAGGPYVLDFNTAHNPLCAYGGAERFACPRAPAENRLSVRIEAGERGYKRTPAAAEKDEG